MGESETLAETEAGGGEAQPKPEPAMSRKEKRKLMKKMKRKQTRKEIALKERDEEEDPQELIRMEEEEARRSESVRILFEERERVWIAAMEIRKKEQLEREEEERRIKALEEEQQKLFMPQNANDDGDDGYEYVSVGPPEVIWTEKEVTVKKNIVKVPKRIKDQQSVKEDSDRPTSNPLPPQSEAFDDYKNASLSAQQLIEAVAEQVPNFGTEQDKDHCPFHLKTGTCRFGNRCSRAHFYPDKSSTLLIKNMYNGPGLTWEQDEGLEYTDEEIERHYEEFYEDVHTEFLKFGEIINFKVCINGASHLRGNVYVQYSALESAVVARQFMNARFFAGKQISCDFINVTKWKVAICGEYLKSRYKTCSRGTACNFIHCFRNPGGDYEWADSDRPPPKYWVEKMVALFGYSDAYKKTMMEDSSGRRGNSSKMSTTDSLRYVVQRSISRDRSNSSFSGSGRRYDKGNYASKGTDDHRPSGEENVYLKDCNHNKNRKYYNESDEELLDSDGNIDRDIYRSHRKKRPRCENRDHRNRTYETKSDEELLDSDGNVDREIYRSHRKKRSRRENRDHRNRMYETESDGELLDSDRNMYRDIYQSHKKKRSRQENRDHKNRTFETESDGELLVSDGNMDRCIYQSCRKERSRQENRYHDRKFEIESDGHLLERGPNVATEHDGTGESSSQQQKAGVRHRYGDCEKAHEAGEDWSTREGDKVIP